MVWVETVRKNFLAGAPQLLRRLYRQTTVDSSRHWIGRTVPLKYEYGLICRMTNSQRLATVRDSFLRCIADEDADDREPRSDALPAIEAESILVREEFYCGRRFRSESHHAVWFIEEDTLKIYRNDGSLIRVLRGDEIDSAGESPAILPMPGRQIANEDKTSQDDEIRRAA